ncbi:von Willebrand factor type A domain-containing protein [Roseibacillus persicicus]|uniref:YfbK domain-containing protein n=1 Tax=Roseibacillus persicicus TaxID=454148 RepID=UPI00398A8E53
MKDDFEIVGDAAREARIVAVVLGEASDFEREEVDRLCEENPELQVFRRRMEAVHGLIGEARSAKPGSDTDQWKLSGERRNLILSKLAEEQATIVLPVKKRVRFLGLNPWQYAALIAVACLLLGLLGPMRMKSSRAHLVSSPAYESAGELLEEEVSDTSLAQNQSVAQLEAEIETRLGRFREPSARKPSAPSSEMAKVIAANTVSPSAVPVPQPGQQVDATQLGDGADFGTGWGYRGDEDAFAGKKNEVATLRRSLTQRTPSRAADETPALMAEAERGFDAKASDTGVVAGRGLRSGDFALGKSNIDGVLNDPNRTAGDDAKDEPLALAGVFTGGDRPQVKQAPTRNEVGYGIDSDLSAEEDPFASDDGFGGAGLQLRTEAERQKALVGARVVGESDGEPLLEKRFALPPDAMAKMKSDMAASFADSDPFAAEPEPTQGLSARQSASELLSDMGVTLPEGATARYLPSTGELVVKNTAENIDLVDQIADQYGDGGGDTVDIKTKFVDERQANTDELGFAWLAGEDSNESDLEEFKNGRVNIAGNTKAGDRMLRQELSEEEGMVRSNLDLSGVVAGSFFATGEVQSGGSGTNGSDRNAIDRLLNDSTTGGLANDFSVFPVTPATGMELGQQFPTEYEPPELPNSMGTRDVSPKELESRIAELEEKVATKEQALSRARSSSKAEEELVELATEMHDYKEAAREYESSLADLQELKLKHSAERVGLRAPKAPVVIHDKPEVPKKKSGFLGLGSYESEAVLQLTSPSEDFGSTLGIKQSRQFFDTQEEVVRSTKTLEVAVEENGLAEKWGLSKDDAVKRLKRSVEVSQRPGTDLLEIKGKSKDPKVAKEIASAVSSAFQKRRLEEEAKRAESQLEAINAEVDAQKEKVEAKRKVLDTIVRITGRPYFEGSSKSPESMESSMAKMADRNLFEMKKDRDQYRIYLDKLKTLDEEQVLRYAAELPVDNNSVRSLHAEYLATKRKAEALKASGLAQNHPDMVSQRERIAGLRNDLDSAVATLTESLGTNYEMIREQLAATGDPEEATRLERELKAEKEELARLRQQGSPVGNLTNGENPKGFSTTASKLENIIIPHLEFRETSLEDAIEFLNFKAFELDPDPSKKKLKIVVEKGSSPEFLGLEGDLGGESLLLGADPTSKSIDVLRLRDVPFATALEYVANKTGMRYRIDEDVITLLPIGSSGSADLVTRTWKISPEEYQALMAEATTTAKEDPFASEDEELSSEVEALQNSGVSFPDGASVRYLEESGVIVVRNTVSNLDLADQIIEKLSEKVRVAEETSTMDEKDAATQADSTFSVHVSDVSFKLAKAALDQGRWPETVRVEEFVNAFSYGERRLLPGERVGVAMEQAAHPSLSQRNLLRISLQTAATGRGAGVPLRLTVVLDKSGSMERLDRASAVDEAFRVLTEQLNPGDKVTLVGFSRTPSLLADFVDGGEGDKLLKILRETPSEGGTNVEEALKLARAKALEHYEDGAQNRVILLTDGIANLGTAVPEQLMTLVEGMREEGVAFDACGVGVEGLNDDILEALTRKGDGRYYLLGSTEESGADFAKQVAGALRPAAQNVKVQVLWNPERVGKWRLYGFEKHELKKEDFRNDAVDAAEMAAEEEGVALYHVEVKPDGEGLLGVARVRFLDVASNEMVEREWEIGYQGEAPNLSEADSKVRLASVAGLVAEKLARSPIGERVEWDELLEEARQLKGLFPKEKRVGELEVMIEKAKQLE